ncbi:unnamed protein product [Mytilus coruscus]|uniref:Uncharacterized protein n=1 Tax=Mytilus coruscus TaxID=42192 RepID=A0A6J8AJC8_MYTCO|nr:unnamed protein product [Mytilus coruscus]
MSRWINIIHFIKGVQRISACLYIIFIFQFKFPVVTKRPHTPRAPAAYSWNCSNEAFSQMYRIAEISRQIQSLSESTIQHGQGFISSTPRDQSVPQKVVENKEHDSGVVTTGPSLSTPVRLAVGDTLPLPDGDIISNPHVSNRKSIGQDKNQYIHPKKDLTKHQSTAHTVSSGSNDVKIKPSN